MECKSNKLIRFSEKIGSNQIWSVTYEHLLASERHKNEKNKKNTCILLEKQIDQIENTHTKKKKSTTVSSESTKTDAPLIRKEIV
jgi:hypothetical protein